MSLEGHLCLAPLQLRHEGGNHGYGKWHTSGMESTEGSTPLNDAQHESFALSMAEGRTSQGRAYLDVGYECKSIDVAYAAASRLLRNVKVQARIQYLKQQAADKTMITRASIDELLLKNALDAREFKQFAASNQALELLGRDRGMFKDGSHREVELTPSQPYADMTPEERRLELQDERVLSHRSLHLAPR